MSIKLNLSGLELDQDIGTVFSTLRPNQDKRKTNSKKLKLPNGISPEKYQDYCNKAYGYSDFYWLQISHLDYHYSRNKTQLPVVRSLYTPFLIKSGQIPLRTISPRAKFRRIVFSKNDFEFCLSTLKEVF
jgi:hypothetical protein